MYGENIKALYSLRLQVMAVLVILLAVEAIFAWGLQLYVALDCKAVDRSTDGAARMVDTLPETTLNALTSHFSCTSDWEYRIQSLFLKGSFTTLS